MGSNSRGVVRTVNRYVLIAVGPLGDGGPLPGQSQVLRPFCVEASAHRSVSTRTCITCTVRLDSTLQTACGDDVNVCRGLPLRFCPRRVHAWSGMAGRGRPSGPPSRWPRAPAIRMELRLPRLLLAFVMKE